MLKLATLTRLLSQSKSARKTIKYECNKERKTTSKKLSNENVMENNTNDGGNASPQDFSYSTLRSMN